MATETHLAARQFRLQQWTAMVQECNSRPAGMKVPNGAGSMALQKMLIIIVSTASERPVWIP